MHLRRERDKENRLPRRVATKPLDIERLDVALHRECREGQTDVAYVEGRREGVTLLLDGALACGGARV